ncbi:MAG: hypothetical protein NTX13_10495 [Acidobacteria bacterium]|nr:hypothetical protein [Acidobacteriota bacterium]
MRLARYDRTKLVVIDPAVMVHATFPGVPRPSLPAVVADEAGKGYLAGQSPRHGLRL